MLFVVVVVIYYNFGFIVFIIEWFHLSLLTVFHVKIKWQLWTFIFVTHIYICLFWPWRVCGSFFKYIGRIQTKKSRFITHTLSMGAAILLPFSYFSLYIKFCEIYGIFYVMYQEHPSIQKIKTSSVYIYIYICGFLSEYISIYSGRFLWFIFVCFCVYY